MIQDKTEKRIAVFLIVIFIMGLIPILLIAKYNYPCADDFGFSAYSRIAWKETHSLLQVLKGAMITVKERWLGWQGTFSSIFVMALQPAIFGEDGYRMVPWIMIGTMCFSSVFLFHTVLRKLMLVRRPIFICITVIYLFFALECMIDKTQGFFWFNGAAHYMIPHSIAVVLCGVVLLLLKEDKHIIRRMSAACLAALFVGGSNYVTGLSIVILFFSVLVAVIYLKKRKYLNRLLLPFILFVIAFLMNICAPGNMVRQEEVLYRPGVANAILMSFYYCVEYITEIWFDWTYIIFILSLIPFLWEVVKTVGNKFRYNFPLIVMIASFCFLSAMFTPSLYAMGEAGGGRIFNIIFLDYLFLIILNLYYVLGWIYNHSGLGVSSVSCIAAKEVKLYFAAILLMTVFIGAMYCKVNPDYFTSVSAVKSLVSGEAKAYGEETSERTMRLQNNTQAELKLPLLKEQPFLLYYSDIGVGSDDWKNNSMERYYQIDNIIGVE